MEDDQPHDLDIMCIIKHDEPFYLDIIEDDETVYLDIIEDN